MATLNLEAFSLSHAAILDGSTGAEAVDGDIYGVDDASLEPNTDSFENTGDDVVLSRWEWLNYAEVSVRGGYIPFRTLQALYGETIVSSGTDPDDWYSQEFWTDRSMNVAAKPMLIAMPAKDSAGTVRTLWIVLYKCTFGPITFEGPSYKEGLKVSYRATALMSDTDEKGASLGGYKAVGRIVSAPANAAWDPNVV